MGRSPDRVAGRRSTAELAADLGERPFAHDFFHLLRRFECAAPSQPRIGTAVRPADETLRLGQDPSLAFAPAALAALRPGRKGGPPWLLVNFLGLLGPNGPLPLHLTDFARERLLHGDATLPRFLDLFHHRFLAMFYRAWSQAQPTVRLDRADDDGFARYAGSFIGVGTREFAGRDAVPDHAKYFYAGWLARSARNADGLAAVLRDFFGVGVRVEEFVGHWLRLAPPERTRLGAGETACVLGGGAVVGARVWDLQHKFRLELGPLKLAQYEQFLPGGRSLRELVAWVRNYLGFELEWDVRLALRAHEVPATRLGAYGRLGWTTWLGRYRPRAPARDLALDAEGWIARASAGAATR